MTEKTTDPHMLTVVGFESIKERGLEDRRLVSRQVDAERLSEQVTLFLQSLETVLGNQPDQLGKYTLDAISVTAEVSAKGTVGLLGTGAELAGKGGLTFTFKRGT